MTVVARNEQYAALKSLVEACQKEATLNVSCFSSTPDIQKEQDGIDGESEPYTNDDLIIDSPLAVVVFHVTMIHLLSVVMTLKLRTIMFHVFNNLLANFHVCLKNWGVWDHFFTSMVEDYLPIY